MPVPWLLVGCWQFLEFLGLCTHYLDLCLRLHLAFCVCVCVCLIFFPFLKDISHIALFQYNLILTNYIRNDPVFKYSFILDYGG